MFKRVLIVCAGNICRSPVAERLLRNEVGGRGIEGHSAGLTAVRGHAMDATARELLEAHGADGEGHVARQVESTMLRQHDLILAMDRAQLSALRGMAPEASGKLFLLGKWIGDRDIPDPYRQHREAFVHVQPES